MTERHKLISASDMSVKMATNGIRTHACSKHRHTLKHRSQKQWHSMEEQVEDAPQGTGLGVCAAT